MLTTASQSSSLVLLNLEHFATLGIMFLNWAAFEQHFASYPVMRELSGGKIGRGPQLPSDPVQPEPAPMNPSRAASIVTEEAGHNGLERHRRAQLASEQFPRMTRPCAPSPRSE